MGDELHGAALAALVAITDQHATLDDVRAVQGYDDTGARLSHTEQHAPRRLTETVVGLRPYPIATGLDRRDVKPSGSVGNGTRLLGVPPTGVGAWLIKVDPCASSGVL